MMRFDAVRCDGSRGGEKQRRAFRSVLLLLLHECVSRHPLFFFKRGWDELFECRWIDKKGGQVLR